jgi:hypothetical protein
MTVAVWPRERYVIGGGAAEVALVALASVELPDPLPVSRTRHGMPGDGDGPGAVAIAVRTRDEDPAWFASHVVGPFADLLAGDLPADAAAAALAATRAYVIEARLPDPDDLGHLQAAWALAKCVCEEGALAVVDVYAARAHLGADVARLVPERAFDVMHEVTLFFEELGNGALAAWTLGLHKFGRPDLVITDVAADAASDAALALRDVAVLLADGERVEPGDVVEAPGGRRFVAERFDPARIPVVAVEREALLLR